MAAVIGLGHVGIFVRDLERMVEFYRDFLGGDGAGGRDLEAAPPRPRGRDARHGGGLLPEAPLSQRRGERAPPSRPVQRLVYCIS